MCHGLLSNACTHHAVCSSRLFEISNICANWSSAALKVLNGFQLWRLFRELSSDLAAFATSIVLTRQVDVCCSVGIELPQIEVRYENLSVEADCYIGNRALPSLTNVARNFVEV